MASLACLSLPALYFSDLNSSQPLQAKPSSSNDMDEAQEILPLPHECLAHVLTFASASDHAKLATVQRAWCDLLLDAARHSNVLWELAQTWLQGTAELPPQPRRAFALLQQLAAAGVNDDDDDDTVSPHTASSGGNNTMTAAAAMNEIANCYFTGRGVEQCDPARGVYWLERAFDHGLVEASHELALTYEYGKHGIEIDVVAAAVWLDRGAHAGHLESMAELALCYELGCGVEQNDTLALDWYVKAAEQGHLIAKFAVGEAYEEAKGVPQSDAEACLWYYKAAVLGDEDARVALCRLADIARIVVPGVAVLLDG